MEILTFVYNLNAPLVIAHKHVTNGTLLLLVGTVCVWGGGWRVTDRGHYESEGVVSPLSLVPSAHMHSRTVCSENKNSKHVIGRQDCGQS